MNANINVTIKTIPHPNPKQAIDTMARIILKEIYAREDAFSEEVPTRDLSCGAHLNATKQDG